MNRQYFSEVVLDTVQANIRTQESFSAWDITKQVRQFIENDDFPTEVLDCPLMDNGSRYNIQHDRVKALVHQYMNAVLDHLNYDSVDTGKYIEYRYVDPDKWADDSDEDLDDTIADFDDSVCEELECGNCSCSNTKPPPLTTASADWRDTKPSPKINSGLPDYNEALTILRNYGLLK